MQPYSPEGIFVSPPAAEALRRASKASSISVTRPGAAASIPTLNEVLDAMKEDE